MLAKKQLYNKYWDYLRTEIDLIKLPISTLFIWITFIKLSTSLIMVLIIHYLELGNVWLYPDFRFYSSNYNYTSPNFGYSIFIGLTNATSISDTLLVTLSCLLSGFIDTLCVFFFISRFNLSRMTIVLYILFCLHPYFSFYTFRFDTTLFGKLACTLFIGNLLLKEKINSTLFNYIILILSTFRITNALFLISNILNNWDLLKSNKKIYYILNSFILVIFLFILFYLNFGYIKIVANATKNFDWNIEYIQSLFGKHGFIFDYTILYALKSIILFGGREAIYTSKLLFFQNSIFPYLEYLSLFVLAIFHIYCLAAFVTISKKNKFLIPVLVSLSLLVFCVLTVGHMRYLVSYYPMILIGWLSFSQKFLLKKVK